MKSHFSKRIYENGQQAHDEMFNVPNKEMQVKKPSHPLGCLEWFKWKKKKTKINVDTDVEKFGPSYTLLVGI